MVPDLKVWRNVAVMLAIFSLFIAYRLQLSSSLAYLVFEEYKSQITDMHHSGKDTIDILFLGTSLTKYALGPSGKIAVRHLESALKQPVRLERMVINSVNADLLLQNDIPSHIEKYHPDYIFLEGNMFLITAGEENKAVWDRNFSVFYMTKYPFSIIHPSEDIIGKIIDNLKYEFSEAYLTGKQDLERTGTLRFKKFVPVSKNTINAWQNVIRAVSRKSSIVVIQYPVGAGPTTYDKQLNALLNSLVQATPNAVWNMPDSVITKQMFVDDAHMSAIGTERFLDWIALKITTIHDKAD